MDKKNNNIHKSTYTMEAFNHFKNDDFDEDIHEYIHRINNCSNPSEAIRLRSDGLKFIDQWRFERLEELDQRVRLAGQLILNTFDEYQIKQSNVNHSDQMKQSRTKIHHRPSIITSVQTIKNQLIGSKSDVSTRTRYDSLEKTKQNIEISNDKIESLSSHISLSTNRKVSLNSNNIVRDFTFETLALLSSSSNDIAMTICENDTLIYCQNSNELVIVSLRNPKHTAIKQLDRNSLIHDLCYVDWLSKCMVIADKHICLLDYRTIKYDIIGTDIGYICGAIDNQRHLFYLIKQSTLYKYDHNFLFNDQADQYPIADGYLPQRMTLDNKTNDSLALLVFSNDEKNYILVYSTLSLADGYLYKIIIHDYVERKWICSNGNNGWLIRGEYPGSCFDLSIKGLDSIRRFDSDEIRNIIPMNEHQRFIVRTNGEIFVLIKYSFIQTF